jgi:hypothetical protein
VFDLLREVPGDGFAFVEGIFGCGKTLLQVALAKVVSDLGLRVAPTKAAIQALSKKMAKYFPDVNAVRVVYDDSKQTEQFDDDKGTTASNKNDLQDHIESQAMFRLPRSNITFRTLR